MFGFLKKIVKKAKKVVKKVVKTTKVNPLATVLYKINKIVREYFKKV